MTGVRRRRNLVSGCMTLTVAVKGSGYGPYTVSGYVDSQNPLGAYLRLNYTCELKTASDGHWDLIDLKLVQQGADPPQKAFGFDLQ